MRLNSQPVDLVLLGNCFSVVRGPSAAAGIPEVDPVFGDYASLPKLALLDYTGLKNTNI